MTETPLPAGLRRLVELFAASPRELKIQALVDYAERLADPPPELVGSAELHRVHECQTPFFVAVTVDGDAVRLDFDVPRESPTMRGFAGILKEGLDGATVAGILAVPEDLALSMGLTEVLTPLRLRGMAAVLRAIKAEVIRHDATGGRRGPPR